MFVADRLMTSFIPSFTPCLSQFCLITLQGSVHTYVSWSCYFYAALLSTSLTLSAKFGGNSLATLIFIFFKHPTYFFLDRGVHQLSKYPNDGEIVIWINSISRPFTITADLVVLCSGYVSFRSCQLSATPKDLLIAQCRIKILVNSVKYNNSPVCHA